MQIANGQFWQGDCLDLMRDIPSGSVDMVLCDLPYGTTACSWDSIIPFPELWSAYKRICKPNAAIVLTASQPFTSVVVMSNPKDFKVEWIWRKNAGSNFAATKWQPMKEHESVLVFSNGGGKTTYNPIKQERAKPLKTGDRKPHNSGKRDVYAGFVDKGFSVTDGEMRVPSSVQNFNRERGLHPTQKPVALFEYLIKTYTNPGELVLDNTAGSGTTAVAAERTGRRWICIERDEDYYLNACARVLDL